MLSFLPKVRFSVCIIFKGSGRSGLYLVITPICISHYFIAVRLDFVKPDVEKMKCTSFTSVFQNYQCYLKRILVVTFSIKVFITIKSGKSKSLLTF